MKNKIEIKESEVLYEKVSGERNQQNNIITKIAWSNGSKIQKQDMKIEKIEDNQRL